MSREVPFYTPFCVFLLSCATIVLSIKCVDSLPNRCLQMIELDIDEIEDHLSKVNLMDVPTVKMMAAGFKCPISALPFGALKSDWSRLLLLQEAQPNGSIIKHKLIRLMRILIIAYYQMEESFDVIKSDAQILQQSPGKETTTTKVDVATARLPSSLKEAAATTKISFVPVDVRISNATSSIDLSAVSTLYHPAETGAENAASRALGNCLKQTLKDLLSRNRPNRTRYGNVVVFEGSKSKKHGERVHHRRRNEINGRAKNADIPAKISPPANDFWRYAHFPAGLPLTISSTTARPYREQGLNGFRTNPRKSRKRAGLNSDGHTKSRGQFYGA
ncbi:PREDICTED: uncharacterized protein LOC106752397 [Dinoponera quadriceps]|uniref:Uncharacterized protein LOC106752397 n=1 Tax=Dinoponera quadriceps TaxID=609295 RepID=A0A6P3YEP9_DINQU|nr:PREDICTED: uncharacterized protein LOC106752397 [Dinoponera quadriceps]